jgi:hypothetical protein
MADTVRVDMDETAIEAMFTDWSSPVGLYIERLTQEVETVARDTAPVSARGSKYAPPGYLKSRVFAARQHAADGTLMGMVGVPLAKGSRYPLPFVSNPSGKTWNRGRRTARRADNKFLIAALDAVMRGR